jgi:hypothetical protein
MRVTSFHRRPRVPRLTLQLLHHIRLVALFSPFRTAMSSFSRPFSSSRHWTRSRNFSMTLNSSASQGFCSSAGISGSSSGFFMRRSFHKPSLLGTRLASPGVFEKLPRFLLKPGFHSLSWWEREQNAVPLLTKQKPTLVRVQGAMPPARPTVAGFSRYCKYTLGTELRNHSREIVGRIVRANSVEDKRPCEPTRTVCHGVRGKALALISGEKGQPVAPGAHRQKTKRASFRWPFRLVWRARPDSNGRPLASEANTLSN